LGVGFGMSLGPGSITATVWVFLTSVSLTTALAVGPIAKCSNLVVSPHYKRFLHQAAEGVVALPQAIPDYDPSNEVLVVFHYMHVSLYFGKYFWEWSGERYKQREHPHAIPQSVTFRLRVGADRVRALEQEVESQKFHQIAHLTCQHRALALLQRNGIRLARGPALWGTGILRAIASHGFVDAKGTPYPMTIHSIHSSGTDQVAALHEYLKGHHAQYFLFFCHGFVGMTPEELAAAIANCTRDADYLALPGLLADERLRAQLTPKQVGFLNLVLENWERRLLILTERYLGPPSDVFMQVMTMPQLPVATYRPHWMEALGQSVCEAVGN
jgi:hypothetical protein